MDTKSKDEAFRRHLQNAPQSLCVYPVSHVNFKYDGGMSCCFRADSLEKMSAMDVETFWNSEKMKTIRKNMVNGIQSPECGNCWRMENAGGFSYRDESLSEGGAHTKWRSQFELLREDGSMPFQVKQAELRFSNMCNLQCRMCSPQFSTKWENEMRQKSEVWNWLDKNHYYEHMEERLKAEFVSPEKILDFVRKSAPHLEYLMITGGEPFIDTSHIEALKILKPYAKNITLEYTTNLNTLTKSGFNVLDYWQDFKQILLKVSIDGDPENYSYVRHGGDIEAVIENSRKIFERYPVTNVNPNNIFPEEKVVLIGTCTVSVYNIARLDQIASFITRIGGVFHTSQVHYPPFLSTTILPAEAKAKITAHLQQYLSQVDERIDWGGHPLWKSKELREFQMNRIYRFVKNSLLTMNGKDNEAKYFGKFLEFEKAFNRSKNIPDEEFKKFLRSSHLQAAAD